MLQQQLQPLEVISITTKSKKRKKHTKIKEPKGYVSGFNFYAISIRSNDAYKSDLAKLNNNEINKYCGKLWGVLPQVEKDIFDKLSDNDKLRYLRDVHAFNAMGGPIIVPKIDPPPGYGLDGLPLPVLLLAPPVGGVSASTTLKRGRKADPLKSGALKNATSIQRPRTAYSLFAHQEKDFLSGLKCSNLQRLMGQYLGTRWKSMHQDEKNMYDLLAKSGATTKKSKFC